MRLSKNLLLGLAIVAAAASGQYTLAQTDSKDVPAFRFRGVEPGATTEQDLLKNPKWGEPARRVGQPDGSSRLEFPIRGYRKVVVTVRDGLVRTIDVGLPEGVTVAQAAEAFRLGKPVADAELPAAATIGVTFPADWKPRRYSAGRVLLLVDATGPKEIARAMRVYGPDVIAGGAPAAAQHTSALRGPSVNTRQLVQAVGKILADNHLTGYPLGDGVSRRWLHLFLKTLDPAKVYFNQADIDQFRKRETQLDNLATAGEVGFMYEVFQVYLKRVAQRVAWVDKLLAAEHDFTVDETMLIDAESATFPQNDLEAREIWRKRIKYDLLMQRAEGVEDAEARRRLGRRYRQFLKRMHQTNDNELLEIYLTALAGAFDPNSKFFSAGTLENFTITQRLNLEGIGASLKLEEGNTVVVMVIPGGPAARDGRLQEGDKIVGVGQGGIGPIEDVVGWKLPDVVDKIRGKRGSMARLKVIPAGQSEPVVYNITRDKIILQGAQGEVLELRRHDDVAPLKIGYIDLPSFYADRAAAAAGQKEARSSTLDVRKLLAGFQKDGIDAVIVDLRRNGGGLLSEAVSLPDLFLDEGPIMQVKGRDGKVQTYSTEHAGAAWSGPLVLLTSRMTASGAEIFAGAVQDYARGLIVGDCTTNGHAVVGNLFDVGKQLFPQSKPPKLGAVKVTTGRFYRPGGDSPQVRGISADVELPSLTNQIRTGQEFEPYRIDFDRVDPAALEKAEFPVDDALAKQLDTASRSRREKSKAFQDLAGKIDRQRQRNKAKRVPLEQKKFHDQWVAADANTGTKKPPKGRSVVERDDYLNEALEITADYAAHIELARANKLYAARQYRDAVAAYEAAIRADPSDVNALYRAAWALSTCPEEGVRNGMRAVVHASRACELSDRRKWSYLLALSVAHAEAGNFKEASQWLEKALALAPAGQREAYRFLEQRFKDREPYQKKTGR